MVCSLLALYIKNFNSELKFFSNILASDKNFHLRDENFRAACESGLKLKRRKEKNYAD
jgi:hypothetical protein